MKNCYFLYEKLCKKEAINCATSKILFIEKRSKKVYKENIKTNKEFAVDKTLVAVG